VKTNFTVIPNCLTEDETLSWKAKGILVYLLGRPNDWEINIPHLSKVSTDGESSTRNGFSELEKAGYAIRIRHTNDAGQIVSWSVYVRQDRNDPWPFENPDVENPHVENPDVENRHQLNKDNTKKVIEVNKEEQILDLDMEDSGEDSILDQVKDIWATYIESLQKFKPKKKKPVLSRARIDLIKRRLKTYTVDELKMAVTGWEHSSFHRGDNEDGKVWNTIELFLRNDEKIEQFIGYHSKAPSKGSVNQQWGRDKMKIQSTTILSNED
jgi:hypothetical protein